MIIYFNFYHYVEEKKNLYYLVKYLFENHFLEHLLLDSNNKHSIARKNKMLHILKNNLQYPMVKLEIDILKNNYSYND